MPARRARDRLVGVLPAALLAGALATLASPAAAAQANALYTTAGRGDVTEEERALLRTLIEELRFTDLAAQWLDARLKTVSAAGRPELEWRREADLLLVVGDTDGYSRANQALAERYPNHPRARTAELQAVQAAMARVLGITNNARYETDSQERTRLLAERDQIYRTEVVQVLEQNIARLGSEAEKDPDDESKALRRDEWEHYRIRAMQLYAQQLPEGSAEAEQALEKLVELAQSFVDQRFLNFALQFDAQLMLGQSLAALGRSEEAAEALELLIEIEPVAAPPFPDPVVRAIRLLRIQALQGSAEAWNRAGRPEKAVELFDAVAGVPQPHFPWRKDPEDPAVLPFVVSMEIEEAIARLAGGVRREGIRKIRTLIDRFDSEAFRRGDPAAAESYLFQIAGGLARAVDAGVADLPAELYHRAALGLQGQGRYTEAIRAAQLALEAGGGVPGEEYWVAASLFAIGEAYDSIDMPEPAALAYQTLALDYFRRREEPRFDVLLADAGQNWFALAGGLAETRGGPWVEITGIAQGVFAELSRGEAGLTLQLQEATELENRGQYERAREIFLGIPRTVEVDGRPQPVLDQYYRARAAAARCLVRGGIAAGNAAEAIAAAVAELEPLIAEARTEKHAAGEAVLRFELSNAHWNEHERDRAAAIAALEPLLSTVTGRNPYREGALLQWITVLAWGNPEDPGDGPRPQEAEPVLAALRTDFGDSVSTPIALFALVEAYQGVGTEEALARAGRLAHDYTKHREAKFAEAAPGVKLTVGRTLSQGGLHKEAAEIFAAAKAEAGDDPLLRTLITLALAEAAIESGQCQDALDSLDEYIVANEDDTLNGRFEEAPYLLYQRAMAEICLHAKDRDAARLGRAEKDLYAALAILQQRRRSLILQNALTPEFERDYWNCFLQYLLVLRAQDRCEAVVSHIKGERIKKGGEAFAPPALQAEFDQLEKDCQ